MARNVIRQEYYRATVKSERQFLLPDDIEGDYDPDIWDEYEIRQESEIHELIEGPVDSDTVWDEKI